MMDSSLVCPICGGYTDESPIPYQKARDGPGYECDCPECKRFLYCHGGYSWKYWAK